MEQGLGAAPGWATRSSETLVAELGLQGFPGRPRLQLPLSAAASPSTPRRSRAIIAVVSHSASLQSPVYFFLCNLATMDIVCTSSVLPKALAGLAFEENTISFPGCMAQLFFLTWSASSELLLLTVMAYGRHVAICRPLHYSTWMSPRLCRLLAVGVWAVCALNGSLHAGLMTRLSFCGPNVIAHFFCEIPPLLLLSCSPTLVNSIMTVLADAFYGVVNFLLTLASYGCIVASILRMRSAAGRRRACPTCSSHLLVVLAYYSAVFCAYISPASSYSPERSKVYAVLYTMLSPTLNPIIYCLRDTKVKHALGRLVQALLHPGVHGLPPRDQLGRERAGCHPLSTLTLELGPCAPNKASAAEL